ncbi:hypothetical protein Ate01nite_53250 [Actinoplanes teichomyceticus]|nr:hypothetical protein Ate01nite_53250 [Actinoplanes teichomyceticus]
MQQAIDLDLDQRRVLGGEEFAVAGAADKNGICIVHPSRLPATSPVKQPCPGWWEGMVARGATRPR